MRITSCVHVLIVPIQSHVKLQMSSGTYSLGDSWVDIDIVPDTVKSKSWMNIPRAARCQTPVSVTWMLNLTLGQRCQATNGTPESRNAHWKTKTSTQMTTTLSCP